MRIPDYWRQPSTQRSQEAKRFPRPRGVRMMVVKSYFHLWQGLGGPLLFLAIVTLISAWGFSRNHHPIAPSKIAHPHPIARRGPVMVNSGHQMPASPEVAQGNPWHPTPLQAAQEAEISK